MCRTTEPGGAVTKPVESVLGRVGMLVCFDVFPPPPKSHPRAG